MNTNNAESQARAQLESIHDMVDRLRHANSSDCWDNDCEMSLSDGTPAEYHDVDEAQQAIITHPLEVNVRSGWYSPGGDAFSDSFMILLCTGGPAVRLIGKLDEHAEPERVQIEYQDWGTPWTRLAGLTDEDNAAMLEYASQFSYE